MAPQPEDVLPDRRADMRFGRPDLEGAVVLGQPLVEPERQVHIVGAEHGVQVFVIGDGRLVPLGIAVDDHVVDFRVGDEIALAGQRLALVEQLVGTEGRVVAEDVDIGGLGRAGLEVRVDLPQGRPQPLEVGRDAAGVLFPGIAEQQEARAADLDPGLVRRRQGEGWAGEEGKEEGRGAQKS